MVFVNKAVLINTPDLSTSFLVRSFQIWIIERFSCWTQFIQLSIAVLLLHIASLISLTRLGSSIRGKVELPTFDPHIAMKLMPLVVVGVVALIFNTLCLKDVDASFFQASHGFLNFYDLNNSFSITDCTRTTPSFYDRCIRYSHSSYTGNSFFSSRIYRHCRFSSWLLAVIVFQFYIHFTSNQPVSLLWLFFGINDCHTRCTGQVCS